MNTAMAIFILTCDMITIFVCFSGTPCLGWIHRIGIATRVKLIFVAEWKNTGWSRIGSTYSKTPLFVFNSSTLTAQLKLKNPDLELSNFFVYVYKTARAESWSAGSVKSVDLHFALVAVPKDNLVRNDPIAEHLEHELHSGQHAWNTNVWNHPEDPQDNEYTSLHHAWTVKHIFDWDLVP